MSGISERNPYVGPRSLLPGEPLHGRAAEVRDLFNLLQARRIVLLHSPSGAGKSSLIHAGLGPRLRAASFDMWRPIRVNLDVAALPGVPPGTNRYLLSAMLSLEEELPVDRRRTPAELAGLDFRAYLDGRPRRGNRADRAAVLVFDQFEEVLTVDPTAVEARRTFFQAVGAALEGPGYWALFVVREDYLGALAPYREWVPTHLANTFRLDLLGLDAALDAVVLPAQAAGRAFPAAPRLVRDLATIQVQEPDGTFRAEAGLHVEPVQLQVVCRRLWACMPDDDLRIDDEDIDRYARIGESLAGYYADAVATAAGGDPARERAIRDWFGTRLVVGGIRAQVRQEVGRSGGLDNALIERLRESYLVRAEQRAGALWFELSHDRMVEPVRADNAAWETAHLHPLQVQAKLWEAQGRPESLLLGADALPEARAWSAAHPTQVTASERDFLARAEVVRAEEARVLAAERAAAARQRRLTLAAAAAAGVALVAAVGAGALFLQAREATARAEAESVRARGAAVEAAARELWPDSNRVLALLLEVDPAERERWWTDYAEWGLTGAYRVASIPGSSNEWYGPPSVASVSAAGVSVSDTHNHTWWWDGAGELRGLWPSDQGGVVSPDGKWKLVGGRLWAVEGPTPVLEWAGGTHLEFSEDGRWVVGLNAETGEVSTWRAGEWGAPADHRTVPGAAHATVHAGWVSVTRADGSETGWGLDGTTIPAALVGRAVVAANRAGTAWLVRAGARYELWGASGLRGTTPEECDTSGRATLSDDGAWVTWSRDYGGASTWNPPVDEFCSSGEHLSAGLRAARECEDCPNWLVDDLATGQRWVVSAVGWRSRLAFLGRDVVIADDIGLHRWRLGSGETPLSVPGNAQHYSPTLEGGKLVYPDGRNEAVPPDWLGRAPVPPARCPRGRDPWAPAEAGDRFHGCFSSAGLLLRPNLSVDELATAIEALHPCLTVGDRMAHLAEPPDVAAAEARARGCPADAPKAALEPGPWTLPPPSRADVP